MGIEFSEEKSFDQSYQNITEKKTDGITKWLIDKKITKDESGAKKIMLLVSFVCLALALYFFSKN